MFVAILIFIIILGLLVFVHELGHFMVARRNGVKAPEFGFGFPPRIVGIQFISGQEQKKFFEMESVEREKIDIKIGDEEIIQETITEKFHNVEKNVPVGKWRIIWGNKDGDDENERQDLQEAHEKQFRGGTIYSLNWFPLGGFVRIKGEDGGNAGDEDSFANKSAWKRIKILAAGVAMNFIFAWILLSVTFMLGAPEEISPDANTNNANSKIQISGIIADAPAGLMGLKVGDEITKTQKDPAGESINLKNVKEVQDYVNANRGKEITLEILRGKEKLELKGTPRVDAPQGQGALGIALSETVLVKYPWYAAIWKGLLAVRDMTMMIFVGLFGLIKMLFAGHGSSADVSGPVGIAILTREVANLGLVYIIQFAAILSINLGIINILPIPALDGGRILFVLIETIKGSPVSPKVEQAFHTFFFALLMLLMLAVTYKDIAKLF
ncbi:MAG: RIP metalloprotease RseP [Candidatus Moranbacteria bacterium]|nr:RIP metalloprotease RseP [Candidatus Moranbacteria bacterium]